MKARLVFVLVLSLLGCDSPKVAKTSPILKSTSGPYISLAPTSLTSQTGACSSGVTVRLMDNLANPLVSAVETTYKLNSSASSIQIYSDSTCTTSATSISIPAGASQVTFYALGAALGSYTITVTSENLINLELTVNIASTTNPPVGLNEGKVTLMRTTSPEFDSYVTTTNLNLQQQLRDLFFRLMTYQPYFNTRLSWFPNSWVYKDSYAIYPDSATTQELNWVLKDKFGNRLFINWGCSGGTCPQYAADIGNPNFRAAWISRATQHITVDGYKGLFVDDVNLSWLISNGNGVPTIPVDPRTGLEMTLSQWRNYLLKFMKELRASVGTKTEIVHNSVWFHDGEAKYSDPRILETLNYADYYYVEHGVNDGGLTGGNGQFSLNALLEFLDLIHSQGRQFVISGVPSDSAGKTYALANYLLVTNGGDIIADNNISPANQWSGYNVKLGSAKGVRYLWNGLLRRDFEGGFTIVNPPGAATASASVSNVKHFLTGADVNTIQLPAKSGLILLNK